MKNSRKYIKRVHDGLLQKKNERDMPYHYTTDTPYEDNPLESARDHLYLIIPTNPKQKNK
jgi:hypothetical protein